MNLIKYNPFDSKHHPLHTIADHFFNGSIADFVGSDFVNNQPSVNILESDKDFKIELAAPGLEKKDFQLKVEEDQLKIAFEKKTKEATEDKKFTRREFSYSSFERTFNLNDEVDKNNISASYENGILNITIAKKEIDEKEIKRTIEIS